MRTKALVCLLCLMACLSRAQSLPTKVFIVKNGAQTLGPTQFYTTLDPNQVINLKNYGYVLIETDVDSLGIVRAPAYADPDSSYQALVKKHKPAYIKLEKGKSYYFKMGPVMHSQFLDVAEMTERAFRLYVGLNGLNSNPKKYILSSSKGLIKNPQ